MDLLMKTKMNHSHQVRIKDFNKFIRNKIKNKSKKYFFKYCFQCLNSERVLREHKESCIKINDKQTVKSRSAPIELKINFKQLAALFKSYADF